MFANQLSAAIEAADLAQLDQLSRDIWRAHGSRSLTDGEAQHLAEVIHARKQAVRPRAVHAGFRPLVGAFTPRKPQRVPKRPEVIQRRRRLAAAGPLPPALAASFTLGEQAVMRIVGNEIRQHGKCDLFLGQIAARAGCSRRTVQRALKVAAAMGLIVVQERRRRGQKSLTNIIRAISAVWKSWLAKTTYSREDRVTISAPDQYKNSFLEQKPAGTAASRVQKHANNPVQSYKEVFRGRGCG